MECTKVSYETKAIASYALSKFINQRRVGAPRRSERSYYLCDRCGKYHLSSRFGNMYPKNLVDIPDAAFDIIKRAEPEANGRELSDARIILSGIPSFFESGKRSWGMRFLSERTRSLVIWGIAFLFSGRLGITQKEKEKNADVIYQLKIFKL